jgi:transposase
MLFLGVDWAEAHHDALLMDEQGATLARGRVPEGMEGLRRVHEMVGEHQREDAPQEVVVGIETERGLLVRGLLAAGYRLYAVNPLAVSRYRERHAVSGAKSDAADAKVLADLVRTDRHNHRPVEPESELAEAVRVLARAHQGMIWSRQRQVSALRSALREYYPAALEVFGGELGTPEAIAVLALAPTPAQGRSLSRAKIAGALRRAGRVRRIEERAAAIQAVLRAEHPEAPPLVAEAFGRAAAAALAVARTLAEQVAALERELAERFSLHPDAAILTGLPGLGPVLGARVLGEFGDAPGRYADARGRKGYAGTAPITKASGRSRVVLARHARNRRLADACFLWAFCSLTQSPGARRYYDALRARGKTHRQALRQLANRWVGILHACLDRRQLYREEVAWPAPEETLGLAA